MKLIMCIVAILIIFYSCSSQKNVSSYSTTKYQEVSEGYQYSKDIITYNSKLYSPVISTAYVSNKLVSIKLYKSEGIMFYSKEDLAEDSLLKKTIGVDDYSLIELGSNYVIDKGIKYSITEKFNKTVYCVFKSELLIYNF